MPIAPLEPRLLSAEDAAAYLGLNSREALGLVPVQPRRIGRRVLWDRQLLDAWLDREAGLESSSAPANDAGADDPDAVLARWELEHGDGAAGRS